DVENPKLMHSLVVGDRGTDSPALYDHKAFLFDKEKELMVLPIQLSEISESAKKEAVKGGWPAYGEPVFQGAFAYHVTLEDGFDLIGKITHIDAEADLKSGYYYDYAYQVQRSLYIGDVLYTVSSKMIKANDLSNNLEEIKTIPFAVIPKTFMVQDKVQGVFCVEQPCSYQEVIITKAKIKTTTFSGGENGYTNISEYAPYSAYDDMMELLDWDAFQALDDTLGCPGCADGPIETITISDGKGTTKTVKMEAGMQIDGLNGFLQTLRNYVGGGYYYPMEGDVMPVDIGGGIGDTPPSDPASVDE
ncbi:MAG: beta-propeller domain-containing protein, partial [archaeon]